MRAPLLPLVISLCFLCNEVSAFGPHEDPDVHRNASELITSKGYPCEEHYVMTEDGYTLAMQRIPYVESSGKEYKGAVLLVHCLECDATVFITNLANESLGFILSDAGYDVWLANVRGTVYSRKHVKYHQSEWRFWDWTWDQIARYDVPAFVDYVVNATQEEKIYYVGHSQGTMVGFAAFCSLPETFSKIRLFSALAPVARVGHITSPLRLASPLVRDTTWLYFFGGYGKFLPPTELLNKVEVFACRNVDILLKPACEWMYYVAGGFEQQHQLNTSRLDVYFSHTPSGTSDLNVNHYAQQVQSGQFQAYDYRDKKMNRNHYNGRSKPPLYPVHNVTIPVALFSGSNDSLSDPVDVAWLETQLPNIVFSKQYTFFQHLDFIWGLNAGYTVYKDLLQVMAQH